MLHRLVFVAFALSLPACYSPNIPNGMQKCAEGNSCAAGYQCAPDGYCYKMGQLPNGTADMAVTLDMSAACTQASCKAPTPICDPDSKQCVPCLTDGHCPEGRLCKNKTCVPGCNNGHGCGDGGACDTNSMMCKVCKADGDCSGDVAGPRCDTVSGRCVPCLPLNDNCMNGQVCKLVNAQYQCVMGCKMDADCKADGGPPKVCCQNSCVDLTTDGANCGACGKACNMGQACCASACTDTTSDLANCGGCGVACSGKHANWSCMASSCMVTMCQGSYKDCNTDPVDGCEVNTAADPMNCMGCGMKCMLANAVAGCANGCFIQSCNMGFGNCNNMAGDGCEANIGSDKNNCGMCGKVCGAVANGFNACNNSMCIVGGCINGYDDCDKQVPNGCEAKVDADPANCGGCGMACPTPANAVRTCVNNVCGFTCSAGFGNCDNMPGNGCEINTNTNADNCGTCGRVCSANNVAKSCGGGVCNGACVAGFLDCNNNKQTDGCEINRTNDKNNCGACGTVCPMNMPTCVNSVCTGGVNCNGWTPLLIGGVTFCYSTNAGTCQTAHQFCEALGGGYRLFCGDDWQPGKTGEGCGNAGSFTAYDIVNKYFAGGTAIGGYSAGQFNCVYGGANNQCTGDSGGSPSTSVTGWYAFCAPKNYYKNPPDGLPFAQVCGN